MDLYETVWFSVKQEYDSGYCVSERGFQTILVKNLSSRLQGKKIIVEPSWTIAGKAVIPDIVIFDDDKITDIIEIKFVPHAYAHSKTDIRKLLDYKNLMKQIYSPIKIDPHTGKWKNPSEIHMQCRLHFVVVSNYDAEAVWKESILKETPDIKGKENEIILWYGRVGGTTDIQNQWGVCSTTQL